jgi:hypothetical protein
MPVTREKRFAENLLNKEKDLATKDPVVAEERSAASTISPPTIDSETIDSETIDSGGGSMDESSNIAKDIYGLLNVEESAIKHLEKKDSAATERNDAAESAATTSFHSCSTSSITNVPRKKCISSSSGGVLQMKMEMFVLVLFFCLMHGSFAFEGPARHYDGGGDSGDDRIVATKDQMNEISFDLDYSSADSLASSRTADLVSKCSVSNNATATLNCIDAVAAKRAILNETLLAGMLHSVGTSDSDAINLDSNGETCRSIDSADVFDREDEIVDGSNGYGQAARRFDDDDDDDEKLTDCPLGRMSSSFTDLDSIDVQKDGAVGLNVDDITLTSTLASVEFNVKLEQGT